MNEEELESKINEIQKEMIPKWTELQAEEQVIVSDLYYKWDLSITSNFKKLNPKQKKIYNYVINEKKLAEKGLFDFESNKTLMKQYQKKFFHKKPNTRLLIKSYKKFIETFEALSRCKQSIISDEQADLKSYWTNLNNTINHLKIAILRMTFFVYESADLNKASIALPPIYALESDDCQNSVIQQIKLETLYEYIYLCFNFLRMHTAIEKKKSITKNEKVLEVKLNEKSKFFSLILKRLIHLILFSLRIRDDIVTKSINHSKKANLNKVTDIDIYSHYLQNECRLINDYLKSA